MYSFRAVLSECLEFERLMRTRSETKRREIMQAAAALFVEQGYERTSMSAISERVGGSKATLYGYFESKEELLRAVLSETVGADSDELMADFLGEDDLRAGFVRSGERYLNHRLSPLPIMAFRIVATQPAESGFGRDYYADVLCRAWERFSEVLAALMADGHLRQADPWVAAMHLKGLNEGPILEKRLLGALTAIDSTEIRSIAESAADAFLAIYEA